jgi:hypothetical protein
MQEAAGVELVELVSHHAVTANAGMEVQEEPVILPEALYSMQVEAVAVNTIRLLKAVWAVLAVVVWAATTEITHQEQMV